MATTLGSLSSYITSRIEDPLPFLIWLKLRHTLFTNVMASMPIVDNSLPCTFHMCFIWLLDMYISAALMCAFRAMGTLMRPTFIYGSRISGCILVLFLSFIFFHFFLSRRFVLLRFFCIRGGVFSRFSAYWFSFFVVLFCMLLILNSFVMFAPILQAVFWLLGVTFPIQSKYNFHTKQIQLQYISETY